METEFKYGDVVDCAICKPPLSMIIFGELYGPEEYGDIYMAGDPKYSIAIKGHYLTKTDVNIAKADKYRDRYESLTPNKLKDLSD